MSDQEMVSDRVFVEPAVIQRVNPGVAAILCGVVVTLVLYAWLNRYDYRVVEVVPGVFFETKRDTWTGQTCVARAMAGAVLPREVPECDGN
ncbi:MAG TPA: hypothetical protein VGJ75_16285 [Dongiaceae bacterium]